MLKTCIMNDGNLREFGTGIYQTPIFFPCKGLLRLGRHNAFASLLVGVGTVGVVLAYKYGPAISHPFQWMGSCISSRAVNSTQCSPTEELTIPGLQNLSNNCFLNVVLQALATSHIFQSFVENCVQMSNTLLEENAEFMPLAVAVSALLEELSTLGQKRRVASPREVMLGLEGYVANFDLARQQDAAEALEHLLSSLKEECLVYIQQYMPHCGSLAGASVLSDHEFCNRIERGEHISLKTWNQYLHGPLDGTLGSLLTCQSCLFQFSTQFEFFHILPIPPILYSDGNIIEGCTIQDCLQQFTALEWITNYRCNLCSHLSAIQSLSLKTGANKANIQKIKDCNNDEKCSCEALLAEQGLPWPAVYRNAFKQLRIGRCPEVLCINLHRAAINETGELIKKRGHVYFPLVFDLFPYTVAAKEGNRELQENEMQMQMKQSWSMLSHMKDFEIQLERNAVAWRSNFVSQSSCYTASISENSCERNICGSAGQLFPPQDYKHPNDEMPALTETINCENSHSFLKLDAEENGIQNTFFGDQGEKFRDVYIGSEGMPTSFSKNPDGNQSCGCSQFETLQNQISFLRSGVLNLNLWQQAGSCRSILWRMERVSSDWAALGVRKEYLNRLLTMLRRLPDRKPMGEEEKKDAVGRSRAVRVAADLSLAMTARGTTWSRTILSQSRKMSPNFMDFIRSCRPKKEKISMKIRLSRPLKGRDRWRASFLRMRRTLYSLRKWPLGCRPLVVGKTVPGKCAGKSMNAWSKNSMRVLLRGVSRAERSKRREETRTWDARIKMLQSLVPGGRGLDTPTLLQEVADYIQALKMQVDTMQTLANYLTMNS